MFSRRRSPLTHTHLLPFLILVTLHPLSMCSQITPTRHHVVSCHGQTTSPYHGVHFFPHILSVGFLFCLFRRSAPSLTRLPPPSHSTSSQDVIIACHHSMSSSHVTITCHHSMSSSQHSMSSQHVIITCRHSMSA